MAIVVERVSAKVDSTGATGTSYFSGTPAVGNRIIVAAEGYASSSDPTFSATDNATGGSNTYVVHKHQYGGVSNFCDIASAKVDRTVANLGVAGAYTTGLLCFAAIEVSGLDPASPVDVAVGAGDTTSPFEVSTGTLSQADEIVVGVFSFAAAFSATHGIAATTWGGLNPTAIYANDGTINSEYGAAAYKIVSSTSAVTVGFSANNNGDGSASSVAAVSFKAAIVSLDPSSVGPFNISDNGAGTQSGTSPAFSPPGSSWLYASVCFDSAAGASPTFNTPTNTGTPLTWSLVASQVNPSGGAVAVWRAYNASAQSNITVSVSATNLGTFNAVVHAGGWIDVWVNANADQSGAAASGANGTGTSYNPTVNATVVGARVAGVAIDWNANGAPTSTDQISSYHVATYTSGGRAYKSSVTGAPGSVAVNFTTTGTPQWASIVYEILPPAGNRQYARPIGDVSAGSWQPSPASPTTLYDKLDEAVPDDADYIYTTANTTGKLDLTALSTPGAGTQAFRIRARGSPAKKLIARLLEGANVRATITVDPLSSTVTQYTATPSGITSYSNLDLELEVADATSPPSTQVTWGAAGTGASGTTSCAPSYPTGISAATSKLFCAVTGRSNTANTVPTMPSGWTRIGGLEGGTGTWGVDTGTRRVDIFQKDVVDGTETGTVTVSLSGTTANTLRATIFRVEVPSGYGINVALATGADTTNDTSYSAAGSTALSWAANDLLVTATAQNIDSGTATSRAVSATGVTFGTLTNRADTAVTNGNDHRHIVNSIPVTTGSGSSAPTYSYTISAAGSGPTAFLRLRATPPTEFARVTWAEFEVPASGSSDVTISCAVGAAQAVGLSASLDEAVNTQVAAATAAGLTFTPVETVAAQVAQATTQGATASIFADETIPCAIGTAQAVGVVAALNEVLAAGVAVAVASVPSATVIESVNATVGSAQALGVKATLSSDTSIQCQVAASSATGLLAVLVETVQAAIASTSGSGLAATLIETVNALIGQSLAAGLQSEISSGATVNCATAAASASGLPAAVYADSVIQCSVGSSAASGVQASRIGVDQIVQCAVAPAGATGLGAALQETVFTAIGSASAIGLSAAVAQNETIPASLGTASASGVSPSIDEFLNAGVGGAVASGLAVEMPGTISCAIGTAGAVGVVAALSLDIVVRTTPKETLARGLNFALNPVRMRDATSNWNTRKSGLQHLERQAVRQRTSRSNVQITRRRN